MRPITVNNLGSIRLRDSGSGSNIFLMVKACLGRIQNVCNLAVGGLFEHLNTNQRHWMKHEQKVRKAKMNNSLSVYIKSKWSKDTFLLSAIYSALQFSRCPLLCTREILWKSEQTSRSFLLASIPFWPPFCKNLWSYHSNLKFVTSFLFLCHINRLGFPVFFPRKFKFWRKRCGRFRKTTAKIRDQRRT